MATTIYKGQSLQKRSFDMDECFFVNCALKDCDIFYSGGDAQWKDTTFEDCRWNFRGPAIRTVQLLQLLGLMKVQTDHCRYPRKAHTGSLSLLLAMPRTIHKSRKYLGL